MSRRYLTSKSFFTLFTWLMVTSFLGEISALKAAESPQIIYVATDASGNRDIFLINRDGSGKQNLTNNPVADFAPQLSSDGKSLYFVSDRNNKRALYVMDIDNETTKEIPIKFNPKTNAFVALDPTRGFCRFVVPQLSPDNSRIAFVSNRKGEGSIVNIAKIDGSQQKKYKTQTGRYISEIVWSPDSSMIALHLSDEETVSGDQSSGEIWVLDTKKETTRKVADVSRGKKDEWQRKYDAESLYNSYSFTGIKWSPNGKYISFATMDSSGRRAADGPGITSPQIKKDDDWVLLQTGGIPSWSPDGTRLVFSGDGTIIYTLNAKKPVTLADKGGEEYQWSPDDKQIAFWRSSNLVIMDVDNGREQSVTINQNSKLDYFNDDQYCYIADSVSSNIRRIYGPIDGSEITKIVWSTDGSQLLLLSGASLYAMDSVGVDIVSLDENVTEALWRVR